MTNVTLLIWAMVGVTVALKCQRPRCVYFSTSALAIIPIVISQVEFGLLPFVGIGHVASAGLYPLALFAIKQRYRKDRR